MQDLSSIYYILILLVSVVLHEVAHGYAALYFGDKTALYAGRLTLNPLKHIDPIGSVLVPLMLVLTNAPFLIGWAKPVPYNPENLSDKKKGTLWVASAGILTNLAIALVFGILIRVSMATGLLGPSFVALASVIVLLNIVLAVFNLMPFPPLDGSKILFALLGQRARKVEAFMNRFAIAFLLVFIFFLWDLLVPAIYYLFELFTGAGF